MTPLETGQTFQKRKAALEAIPPISRTTSGDRVTVVRAFRGLTLEQAIGYLENLGGERRGEHAVVGPGWRAELTAEKVPVGPSYRLTQVTIAWTGEEAALDPVVLGFRLKAFRAPG